MSKFQLAVTPALSELTVGPPKDEPRACPTLAPIVGKNPGLAWLTGARASSTAAAAALTFWFEISIFCSSPSKSASLKIFHHGPWSNASAGSVGFQPVSSLNAGVVSNPGRL